MQKVHWVRMHKGAQEKMNIGLINLVSLSNELDGTKPMMGVQIKQCLLQSESKSQWTDAKAEEYHGETSQEDYLESNVLNDFEGAFPQVRKEKVLIVKALDWTSGCVN